MKYLTREQWEQIKQNIEEGSENNTKIIVELKLDEYEEAERFYIDWVDEEEVGIVPVSACLIGTIDELLYNYFGDEQQITLYLDEEENQKYRDVIVQTLLENKQVPVRYFVTGIEFEEENNNEVKVENADCIEVSILEQPPKSYFAELIYKVKKYEVKR